MTTELKLEREQAALIFDKQGGIQIYLPPEADYDPLVGERIAVTAMLWTPGNGDLVNILRERLDRGIAESEAMQEKPIVDSAAALIERVSKLP